MGPKMISGMSQAGGQGGAYAPPDFVPVHTAPPQIFGPVPYCSPPKIFRPWDMPDRGTFIADPSLPTYHTRAIITRSLYIFYPIFQCSL